MSGHPQDLSLRAQAAAIAARELDPAELLDRTLERIAERNPPLNAIIETFPERSREMLAAAPAGPLRGVPIGLKDMFCLPWRAPLDGAAGPDARHPAGECAVHRLLRDAGAVIAGVTHAHMYGAGSTGAVASYGPVANAWDPSRVGGGSSGGSGVAVAARMLAGAVGSDGGGSIRFPAAYNGVTGLKPTFGAVGVEGFTHGHETMSAIGPLTRDAADCRLLAEVLLGRPLPAGDARRARIGVVRAPFWENLDPEVEERCEAALDALRAHGATVREIALEGAEHTGFATVSRLTLDGLPYVGGGAGVNGIDHPVVRAMFKYQLLTPAEVLVRADLVRTLLRRSLRDAFAGVDAIAWPSVPAPAPPIEDTTVHLPSGPVPADVANVRQGGVANLTGAPAISVPVGLTAQDLPVGLQFVVPWGEEARALDLAEALERATGREHVRRVPPVAAGV